MRLFRWLFKDGLSKWEYEDNDPKRPMTRVEIVLGIGIVLAICVYMLFYGAAQNHVRLW